MQLTPPLWQKVKRNWRASCWKWKRRVKKAGLKLNIQKTKIMASGPVTSWQIDGETMETVTDLIFLGSQITGDGDCGHEIKRHLLLGRKAMTSLESILKSRDKQKLSTNLILYKAYTNHWTNIRRAETKRKKEFNLEAWEKETSNKISLKNIMKRQRNITQMKKQTRNTEVQINEEEISKLPEKEFRIMIVKMIKVLIIKMKMK